MNTSNLMDLIQHEKMDKANDAFDTLMKDKISGLMDLQRVEVAKNFLNTNANQQQEEEIQ